MKYASQKKAFLHQAHQVSVNDSATLRNAVVLVVDGLGAGFLGPYGNTWVPTPAFNRLAAQSVLVEHAWSDCPELLGAYRSLWQGCHAVCPPTTTAGSLAEELGKVGVATTLCTDDVSLTQHDLATHFEHQVTVELERPTQPARTSETSQTAMLATAGLSQLERLRPPYCLWMHAQGMSGPWDASLELRRALADETDPDPPTYVKRPERTLKQDEDPDVAWGDSLAYAAQIMQLDLTLGWLLTVLDSDPHREDTLLILTSYRGYPLGEHLTVGYEGAGLHSELLHIPLLVRFPSGVHQAVRLPGSCQLAAVYGTLANWFSTGGPTSWSATDLADAVTDPAARLNQRAVSTSGERLAIRTPGWFLTGINQLESGASPSADVDGIGNPSSSPKLFVKPDDRWEVNEIADRRPDIVDTLRAELAKFLHAAKHQRVEELGPIPDDLLDAHS